MRWALGLLIIILALGVVIYVLMPGEANVPAPPNPSPAPPVTAPPVKHTADFSPLSPPPVTLHINDGTLVDVVDQLSASMDIELRAFTPGNQHFTVDLTDVPYWQVVKALQKFGDVGPYQAKDGTFGLIAGHGSEGLDDAHINGPFITWVRRDRLNPADDTLVYTIAADPRTPMVATNLKFTMLDKAGQPLLPGRPTELADRMTAITEGSTRFGIVSLNSPNAEIAAVQIKTRVDVALRTAQATTEIAEAGKELNQVLAAGSAKITVSQLTNNGGIYVLQFDCQIEGKKTPVHLKITPAGGTIRFNGWVLDSYVALGKSLALPCRVEFEVPQEIKRVDMDNTFDISSPQ